MEKAKKDDRIVAITAAMCEATGLHKFFPRISQQIFLMLESQKNMQFLFAAGAGQGRNETCSMHILILSSALI